MGYNTPLVSVIVPIYRIERYLGTCIESIIKQTYKQLEVILVDDGSDDRCRDICDLYSSKNNRIKVIHKENGGLVSARKEGMKNSSGEYIAYVDGDDWIEPDFIERMITDAVENQADIVCAGQTRDLFDVSFKMQNPYPNGAYRGKELIGLKCNMLSYGEFFSLGISTYVWNKLFRREIVFDCQLNVDERISIGEDAAVTYPAILKSDCVCVNDCVSYHYRQREDSMLKKSSDFTVEAEKLRVLYEYMTSFDNEIYNKFDLSRQITDYVLGICIIRSGGRLPENDSYSTFDDAYYNKRVVIYNAGTFGQQLVNRFNESRHCKIVKWIDDDFWEYRRCCLDVDSVESINQVEFDYVLIAVLDGEYAKKVRNRLISLNVDSNKILLVQCPENQRNSLIEKYLYR
ncbi:MAG: glycosyltransferase family 2 protein [Ruminococcus sp.]|nr:glycosyltransferase family 2 protein [Ruminococcus sp.]